MALSGIQIYKMLPQTNCKECGFPTCLAFAMKLAAKQAELSYKSPLSVMVSLAHGVATLARTWPC